MARGKRSQKPLGENELQIPLDFMLETNSWKSPDMGALPSWGQTTRIGLDTETFDPHLKRLGVGVRRGGRVVGISFALEHGPADYLPIGHQGGDNCDPEQVWNYIRYQAKHFTGEIVGANLSYDLDYLWQNGVDFNPAVKFRDVQIADPLINELENSYSLEAIGTRRVGVGKDEDGLTKAVSAFGGSIKTKSDAKNFLWRLPARHVAKYAIQDCRLPLAILAVQERELEAQDLWNVWDMESRLLPILVKMRRRGIRVDQDRLEQMGIWAREEERKALAEIKRVTGVDIPVGMTMTADVCKPMFDALQISVFKTAKGEWSITAPWLDSLKDPTVSLLRRARQMSKVQTTYVNGTKEHLINGRIHCTFNQMRRQKEDSNDLEGAAFGRLSSSNPNLQNQPARNEEIGPRWRSIYIPEEGALFASKDYSQQEPKMAIHFAIAAGPRVVGIEGWERAKQLAQMFVDNPKLDTYLALVRAGNLTQYLAPGLDNEKIVKDGMTAAEIPSRKYTKELQLGVTYGMGGPKLCGKLGLPTVMVQDKYAAQYGRKPRMIEVAGPEGQRIFDVFDEQLPFIRKLAKAVQKAASERGYVKTLSGRRCHFPQKEDGRYDWVHKALNRVIQGSSADQTKEAIIALDDAGVFVQLQVHDEIDSSVGSVEEGRRAATIMTECVPLLLPSRVDLEMGPSWGEAKGV